MFETYLWIFIEKYKQETVNEEIKFQKLDDKQTGKLYVSIVKECERRKITEMKIKRWQRNILEIKVFKGEEKLH